MSEQENPSKASESPEKPQKTEEQHDDNEKKVKRYSFKQNYNFIASIWEKVCVDYPEFSDIQADDLITFMKKFAQLEDQQKYFDSNMQRKRYNELIDKIFRKRYLKYAIEQKKKNVDKEVIIENIKKEVSGTMQERQINRLISNIRQYTLK